MHGLQGVLAAANAAGHPDLKRALVLVALVLPLAWLVALDRVFRRKR